MGKTLFTLFVVLVAGLVGYNYFFGDADEKKQSEEIINQVTNLGKSGMNLVISEKKKFDGGKFDEDIRKINEVVATLKSKLTDSKLLEKLSELEKRKDELQKRINADKAMDAVSSEETAALNKELQEVAGTINKLSAKAGDE